MKNLKTTLILCTFLLMACSEEKEKTQTEVSGKVLEYGTNKPLAGATVKLYEGEPNSVSGRLPILTEKQSTVSASDGTYSISYSHLNSLWYLNAIAPSEDYYEGWDNGELYGSSFPPGEHLVNSGGYTQNIYFYPKAWLKLRLFNQTGADYININQLPPGVGPFYGSNIDTTFTLEVAGNRQMELNIFVLHNNQQTIIQDFVQSVGHDTVYHEIIY